MSLVGTNIKDHQPASRERDPGSVRIRFERSGVARKERRKLKKPATIRREEVEMDSALHLATRTLATASPAAQ